MHRLPSVTLLAGLLSVMGMAARGDEAISAPVPNLSSADFPWTPTDNGFLPPPSGFGPVTYDKANPRMVPTLNLFGEVAQRPLRLADLNNPNLKPWVIDQLKKSNADTLAGKLRYASRRVACLQACRCFCSTAAAFSVSSSFKRRARL